MDTTSCIGKGMVIIKHPSARTGDIIRTCPHQTLFRSDRRYQASRPLS